MLGINAREFYLIESGADLAGGCRGCAPLSSPEMTCGFLTLLKFCKKKKKKKWFIGVEVGQETSAPPPKKNPGSAPENNGTLSKDPIGNTAPIRATRKAI